MSSGCCCEGIPSTNFKKDIKDILYGARSYRFSSIIIIETKTKKKEYDSDDMACDYTKDNKGHFYVSKWDLDFSDEDKSSKLIDKPLEKACFLLARYADHPEKVYELLQICNRIFKCKGAPTIEPEALYRTNHFNVDKDKYVIDNVLMYKKITMENFILNPKYSIFLNGYDTFTDIIKSGLLNVDNIRSVYDVNMFFDDLKTIRAKSVNDLTIEKICK